MHSAFKVRTAKVERSELTFLKW